MKKRLTMTILVMTIALAGHAQLVKFGLTAGGNINQMKLDKEVINEEELVRLMEDRPDFKYVTDIMPAIDAELREKFAGRYFATPKKMGAQTAEANINAGIAAANQIVDYLKNGNTRFQVNK